LWTLFENGAESNKIINAYVLCAICGLLVLNGVQNLHLKFVVNEIITKFLFQCFVKPANHLESVVNDITHFIGKP
jgi:hypothetical protein